MLLELYTNSMSNLFKSIFWLSGLSMILLNSIDINSWDLKCIDRTLRLFKIFVILLGLVFFDYYIYLFLSQ